MFRRLALTALSAFMIVGISAPAAQAYPNDAEVWVQLFNDSGREIKVQSYSGRGREDEDIRVVEPGRSFSFWGQANAGTDASAYFAYCPNSTTFDWDCEDVTRFRSRWKNPFIGWPWMEVVYWDVDKDTSIGIQHGFEADETYSWSPYKTGNIDVTARRKTDSPTGVKRFVVRFTDRE